MYRVRFERDGHAAELPVPSGRSAWVQVVRGSLSVQGRDLDEGDGVALLAGTTLHLSGAAGVEALVFDLPEVNHA